MIPKPRNQSKHKLRRAGQPWTRAIGLSSLPLDLLSFVLAFTITLKRRREQEDMEGFAGCSSSAAEAKEEPYPHAQRLQVS
eukprot:m.147476 g.147476  ORF g.147476 m.147476 type:complete len:81 (+) comp24352_c1_seq4:151-393(+)